MGNKYIVFLLFAAVLIGGGVVYQKYFRPANIGAVAWDGVTVLERNMRSVEGSWLFEPNMFETTKGAKVILHIYNEDAYDHGIGLDEFAVNERIFPKSTTTIQFIASQAGEFQFYCSVACGDGVIDGKPRGHYDQVGKLIVREK
ncbi:MAG: cupredoxin domain-containing protein [Patescibacteria group bacterium]